MYNRGDEVLANRHSGRKTRSCRTCTLRDADIFKKSNTLPPRDENSAAKAHTRLRLFLFITPLAGSPPVNCTRFIPADRFHFLRDLLSRSKVSRFVRRGGLVSPGRCDEPGLPAQLLIYQLRTRVCLLNGGDESSRHVFLRRTHDGSARLSFIIPEDLSAGVLSEYLNG